ncbi:type II toxin-antitoxin system VapC family toxin [Mesorhizobium xinjiangense]|uniref:type II toxin-antitoxin system VapC family toxin n=1 Tax=Mesorhizobium xinjiangense TaxID=2678685 RepID=UPI0012EDE26B|nr:type II toxin-antitoxin system VapC family toxin [Mesorhizobium xinjiangense]
MIVDASALLAILLDEPERKHFRAVIARSSPVEISPVNYLEVCLRIDRGSMPEASEMLEPLMGKLGMGIATVGPEQAQLARGAFKKFGKGNHKARLNLGDCFAYALAKARGEPLLFKGDDFRHTDVEAAL